MKLFAIGLFHQNGTVEHIVTHEEYEALANAHESLAIQMKTGIYKNDVIYKIPAYDMYHYFKSSQGSIRILSSPENLDPTDPVLSDQFSDINEIYLSTDHVVRYNELDKKIADPNYFISPVKRTRQGVEETRQIMVNNIEKLLQRGAKLEELVEKTEELKQNTQSFRSKAFKLNKNHTTVSEQAKAAAKKIFCCFFLPCCNGKPQGTAEERESFLRPNRSTIN